MKFNELRYQDPRTNTYVGSPSLVILPDGDMLAAHDYFGPGCPGDPPGTGNLTSLYRSADGGETWDNISHINGLIWGNLFMHREHLYLTGVSHQFGNIVIRRSEDSGYTWTHPADSTSGMLFEGGPAEELPNYHGSAMPVVAHRGRLYTTFENATRPNTVIPGGGGVRGVTGIKAFVISAGEEDDLLDASNWVMSNQLDLNADHAPDGWPEMLDLNWREGSLVVTPDDELWSMMCVKGRPQVEKTAIVKVHDEGRRVSFDSQSGLIDFPGGMTKFIIRRDESTGTYWTLASPNINPEIVNQRNVLALYDSTDLLTWRRRATLLEDDSDLSAEGSAAVTGFQYAGWQFDGEDVPFVLRTAYDGAHNYHDSNRITFHRVKGFRTLTD
jgi:hypothetical protein